MKGTEFIETPQWSLAPIIGYKHPFLTINVDTVVHTWIILGIITLFLIPVRWILLNTRIGKFLILSFVSFFVNLTKQSLGSFVFSHFSFVTALFTFILACNIAPLIPWLEEPTRDLNTTLALGLTSFFYVQAASIKKHGVGAYIKSYFAPFFILFPLNLVGKLASIISISFRLFGNIFGGSIITQIYFGAIQGSFIFETIGIISGMNILIVSFFTLFAGVLQAFVFGMLTLTYLSIGLESEDSH